MGCSRTKDIDIVINESHKLVTDSLKLYVHHEDLVIFGYS